MPAILALVIMQKTAELTTAAFSIAVVHLISLVNFLKLVLVRFLWFFKTVVFTLHETLLINTPK